MFPHFFVNNFSNMFKKGTIIRGKLFLQRADLSKNRMKTRSAWDEVVAWKFTISARNPDLKSIEKIFDIVRKRLCQVTLNRKITREDFPVFSAVVKTTSRSLTEISCPLARELTKLLNEKNRGVNTSFAFTCKYL